MVAGEAYEKGAPGLHVGMTEFEAARGFRRHLAGPDGDAERADGYVYCMSGRNAVEASRSYARSRAKRLAAGETILVHCNSYVDGYWTDITRTYCIGRMSTKLRVMYEAVFEARAAGLHTIRPGARAAAVDAAVRTVIAKRRFADAFPHSSGHGIGFLASDPTAHPRLHPVSDDVLAPGMVFNLEPAVYVAGLGGVRHCDVVAVTDTGATLLTPFHNSVEALTLHATA